MSIASICTSCILCSSPKLIKTNRKLLTYNF
nr:MAG TPA: hypothetical protein [Caudoviricetes sp.]